MNKIKLFSLGIILAFVFVGSAFGEISRETVSEAWERISEAGSFDVIPIEYEEDGAPNAWVDFEDEGNYSVHVTNSLLEMLDTEDEIAGILAHELGHIQLGHYNREALAEIGQSLLELHNENISDLAKALGKIDIDLTRSLFSREQETEADDYGVKLLVKAGYNSRGLYDAMRHFADDKAKTGGFDTHPSSTERLAHLAEISKADEENKQFAKGYNPSPMDISYLAKNPPKNVTKRALSSTIPAEYDMRNTGRLTPVKNQGNYGTCWAHAAIAACESNYLIRAKKGNFSGTLGNSQNLDLSEMFLAWFAYANPDKTKSFNTGGSKILDVGGNEFKATAILSRLGIIEEDEMPYAKSVARNSKPENFPVVLRIKEATFAASSLSSAEQSKVIKQLIMDKGAVLISYYEESKYHNRKTNAYYRAGSSTTNHMVAIVGWNDNYSREKFGINKPKRNGAWLVRNSWGPEWGGGGYFWISYEQHYTSGTSFTVEPVNEKVNHYGYDDFGWTSAIHIDGKRTSYAANVFQVRTSGEILNEVAFYTTDNGTKYTVSVYDYGTSKPNANNLTSGRKPVTTKSGTMDIAGYHTLKVDDVPLKEGNYFAVVLKVNTPYYAYPLAIEGHVDGYNDGFTVKPGESYFSSDGTNWQDGTKTFGGVNACIKAFTVNHSELDEDEDEEEERDEEEEEDDDEEDGDDWDDDYDEEFDDDDWEEEDYEDEENDDADDEDEDDWDD